MPNITVYVENEMYIKFLQLENEERYAIRKKFVKYLGEVIK